MLSLYASALIVTLGFAVLLVLRAVGPESYKEFFDKHLWTIGDEE